MKLETHRTFAQRLETAHAALVKHIQRQNFDLKSVTYAEEGITLKIRPGATTSVTLRPIYDSRGKSAPGLEVITSEERVAVYLIRDTISAVQSGELDEAIRNMAVISANTDNINGYPTILEW